MGDMGSRTTVTKDTVLADNHIPLSNANEQKQPCRDIDVHTEEGFLEEQMSSDEVGSKCRQGLMNAKKDFIEGSAEERHRKQNDET